MRECRLCPSGWGRLLRVWGQVQWLAVQEAVDIRLCICHDACVPTPDLLSTAEAAEVIGVKVSTISRWVASARMTPAYKIAGRTGPMLFDRPQVERVAAEYAATPEGAAS